MVLVALFALVSVALSAMQVMTSIDIAPTAVGVTSYRFAAATLIALAASCAALLLLYIGLYVWNWLLILFRRYPDPGEGSDVLSVKPSIKGQKFPLCVSIHCNTAIT